MNRFRMLPAVLVLALAGLSCSVEPAAPSAGGAGKVQLAMHLKPGMSYRQRMSSDTDIVWTAQGKTVPTKSSTAFTIHVDVLDPAADHPDLTRVKFTYERVVTTQKTPTGQVSVDSANPPAAASPDAALTAIVGQSLLLTLDGQGQVQDIEGFEAMMENAIAKSHAPDGPAKDAIRKLLQSELGEKANFQQFVGFLPNDPVGVGDRWSRVYNMVGGATIAYDNTWTVTARGHGKLKADVASKLSTPADAQSVDTGALTLQPTLTGTQTGSVVINEKTGWTEWSHMTQEMTGQMVMSNRATGQTITTSLKIKAVVKIEMIQDGSKS